MFRCRHTFTRNWTTLNATRPSTRREPGSAAAPTAGLHFTPRLLDELKAKGVKVAYVTLHVGLDTFAPVTEDDPEEHKIHTEWCELPQETADAINQTRANGRRVVAVGTTSVRTLESAGMGNRESENRSKSQFPNFRIPNINIYWPNLLFISCLAMNSRWSMP